MSKYYSLVFKEGRFGKLLFELKPRTNAGVLKQGYPQNKKRKVN